MTIPNPDPELTAYGTSVFDHDLERVNRLIGLDAAGRPFEFAVNVLNDSELAGARWSPDGQVLFVNIFGEGAPDTGMTCAIYPPAGGWGSRLL